MATTFTDIEYTSTTCNDVGYTSTTCNDVGYTSTSYNDVEFTTTTLVDTGYNILVYFKSSELSSIEYFLTSDGSKFLVQATVTHDNVEY